MTGWQIFSLVCVLAPLVIGLIIYYTRKRKREYRDFYTLDGLGTLTWSRKDRDSLPTAPKVIAHRLALNLVRCWPKYQSIYLGRHIVYRPPADIRLDPYYHKPAEYRIASRILTINPTMDDYARQFCGELHNMFRCAMYGERWIYKPKDRKDARHMAKASDVWQGL